MNPNVVHGILERRRCICKTACALVFAMFLLLMQEAEGTESNHTGSPWAASKAASTKCAIKFREVEEFGKNPDPKKQKTTQFSEDEINSYIVLELKPKFSPGLKRLQLGFKEDSLQVEADIDFDTFNDKSTRLSEKLLASIMSGVHTLTATGRLHAKAGKAYFELVEARLDKHVLPTILVEQIISEVGRRQKPAFDPLQPSQMPYNIKSVDVHTGMIIIYQ